MKFSKKSILIISMIFYVLLNSHLAIGGELIPFLKGQWIGTVLYQATYSGFTSSSDSLNVNISEQSGLNFKGNTEAKNNGKKNLWFFEGYLGKRGRNICFINQSNKKMMVGYMISYNFIKLYSWDDQNNRAIVYILRKIETDK